MKGRKVNQVGKDTLTVSLPKEWVGRNNIKKGMELELEDTDDKIVIHSGHRKSKGIEITLGDINTFLLNKIINDIYIQDIDQVAINFNKNKIFNHELDKEVRTADYITDLINMYIGLEIVSQNEKRIVIQNLIKESEVKNLGLIQKRTHSLLIELVNQVSDNLNSNPLRFESSINSHISNVRKFIYYCIKLIVNSSEDSVTKIKWYVLYDHLDNSLYNIEKATSLLKEMKKISPNIKKLIEEIFNLFTFSLKIMENVKIESVNELIQQRYILLKKISNTKMSITEEKLIRELRIFVNIHHDFALAYSHSLSLYR